MTAEKFERIKNYGIIPVIKISEIDKAVPVAQALISGGLNIAEINPATDCAAKAAKKISAAFPDMLLLIEENNFNLTEEQMKTESIETLNIPEEYIINREFDKIKELAASEVRKMLGYDLAHLVINCENTEQAERDSSKIESLFGLKKSDAGTSIANADILHFMKSKSYGKNGQIAICTNFIERAVFYLKEAKKEFIEESARFDEEGNLISIYLDNIVGGFAIKLVRK